MDGTHIPAHVSGEPVMTVLDAGGGGNLKYIIPQIEPASTLFKPQAAHKRGCQTRPRLDRTSPVKATAPTGPRIRGSVNLQLY
jgi:hypothetical protein